MAAISAAGDHPAHSRSNVKKSISGTRRYGATLIADRIAPQRALLAVTVGIAGTWGVIAVWVLAISERRVSAVIVLCYVIASLALAFVLDRSRSRAKREED
jgi:hypothetical protein